MNEAKTIRWCICDDAEYVCSSLVLALQKYSDLEFLEFATSSDDCITMCKNKKPDILLLDVQMESEYSGINLIPKIKTVSPSTKIIMLTGFDYDTYIFLAFSKGADNYILKNADTSDIHQAMLDIYNEKVNINSEIFSKLKSRVTQVEHQQQSLLLIITLMSKLSRSEYEILRAIYEGKKYKEIAKDRFVELGTIKKRVSRILAKFEVHSMQQLIKELEDLNIFDIYSTKLEDDSNSPI